MTEKKVNDTNEEDKKKKKKLFIIFGLTLGAGAIAGASVGIYFAIKSKAPIKKWYEYANWWNYCSNGDNNVQANENDIGKTVTVIVNSRPHLVRLIDVDKDVDKDNHTIHTTFEFVNLISDSSGYSLATQWNDVNDMTGQNQNYLDSSVRAALVGKHEQTDHILWAQKGETVWSENPLYNEKSVLDMLPDELASDLKMPSKYVNIYNNDSGEWEEKKVEDKLFLLSPIEMGGTGGETLTSTYTYYNDAEDADRVKKQVNNEEAYAPTSAPSISEESGQTYHGDVSNYAGYNESAGTTGNGGYSWLRSPNIDISMDEYTWHVIMDGSLEDDNFSVRGSAIAIAPAFCI